MSKKKILFGTKAKWWQFWAVYFSIGKIIEQHESRLKEKDEIILLLKKKIL